MNKILDVMSCNEISHLVDKCVESCLSAFQSFLDGHEYWLKTDRSYRGWAMGIVRRGFLTLWSVWDIQGGASIERVWHPTVVAAKARVKRAVEAIVWKGLRPKVHRCAKGEKEGEVGLEGGEGEPSLFRGGDGGGSSSAKSSRWGGKNLVSMIVDGEEGFGDGSASGYNHGVKKISGGGGGEGEWQMVVFGFWVSIWLGCVIPAWNGDRINIRNSQTEEEKEFPRLG
ncbi:hypothetical protein GOBAR_DD31096 [Gossypium barbadense]|nr:hypothetical protein GOBAR_DD31096 [Gossypium barbadense]